MEKTYFFETKDEFIQARTKFRAIANDKEGRKMLTAADFLLYSIIRGRDWRLQFTPCLNARKIANGQDKWSGLKTAKRHIEATIRQGALSCTTFGDLSKDKYKEQIKIALSAIGEDF